MIRIVSRLGVLALVLSAAFGLAAQDSPEGAVEILLEDGRSISRTPVGMTESGDLKLADNDGGVAVVPLTQILNLSWNGRHAQTLSEDKTRIYFQDYSVLIGDLESIDKGMFRIKHNELGELQGQSNSLMRIVYAGNPDADGRAFDKSSLFDGDTWTHGTIVSFGEKGYRVNTEEGETTVELPIATAYFKGDNPSGSLPGVYLCLELISGERLIGLMENWTDDGIQLSTPSIGRVTIPENVLATAEFRSTPVFPYWRFSVVDRNGLQEFNRNGEALWKNQRIRSPIGIERLPDGRTIVADRVLRELHMLSKDGSTVWKTKMPQNGYTMGYLPREGVIVVTEYTTGTFTEFNLKGEQVQSFKGVDMVLSIAGTNRGTYLVSTARREVVEVSREGESLRKCMPANLIHAGSVRELPNGNFLLADYGGRRVAEFDWDGKEIWKQGDLEGPKSAFRLPDGSTLVLEQRGGLQRNGRLVEISPDGTFTWKLEDIVSPQAFDID
jgi:hypothetical protein